MDSTDISNSNHGGDEEIRAVYTTPPSDLSVSGEPQGSKCPIMVLADNLSKVLGEDGQMEGDEKLQIQQEYGGLGDAESGHQPPEYKTFFKLHRMNHGITRWNLFASYLGSFLSICFFVFINVAQPFILSNLGIPDSQQGDVSGNLTFYNELTILLASYAWGVLSDRAGRRLVYVAGMLVVAVGLLLYPFANSLAMLYVYRIIFGIGAAALSSMLSAVLADYVVFEDRGRASGFLGFAAGGGAVVGSLVLLKIPALLHNSGHVSTLVSGQVTYAITAGSAVVGAVLLFVLLRKHNPRETRANGHQRNVVKIITEGIKAGKKPVLSLAYGSGFIARGDSAIATTFLSLWIYNYALSVNGGNNDAALSSSGTISGIAQTCALFFALVAGYLMDKLNRVFSMVLLSLVGCTGYFILAFSNDPLSVQFFIGACIIGCAETGMVVASTSLVAQESPAHVRGSVSGFFSQCGCVGILIASKIGGMYFDRWNGFPFFLFGVLSSVLAVWAIIVFFLTQFKSNRSSNPAMNFLLNLVKNDNQSDSQIPSSTSDKLPLIGEN